MADCKQGQRPLPTFDPILIRREKSGFSKTLNPRVKHRTTARRPNLRLTWKTKLQVRLRRVRGLARRLRSSAQTRVIQYHLSLVLTIQVPKRSRSIQTLLPPR